MSAANPNFSDDRTSVECQYDSDTPPSLAIVRSIAVIEDIDPMDFSTDLGVRLYDYVDSEALDRLVTNDREGVTLTVDLTIRDGHQYAVQIRGTGQLTVEKLSET